MSKVNNTLDIQELLARGRAFYKRYDDTNDTDTSVTYSKHSEKFVVASMVHFKVPDDEGGYYWEEDVAGLLFYTPREFNIHLDTEEGL